MGLAEFLQALFEHGKVRVGAPGDAISGGEWAYVDAVWAERHAAEVAEFPGPIPPLSPPAARWAAEQFHRACQFAVYRDAGADKIAAALAALCPAAPAASRHVSVDLTFRFLPDLYRLAHAASPDDPLCERLGNWAADWPLSSVGIANVNPRNIDDVLDHAGPRTLYVDRIIARRDRSRVSEPRVRQAVLAAIGSYRELAADLAGALANGEEPNA